MAQLNLSLLGTISVALDTVPVRAIESDKVRALLAYLAVESDRPQRREHLAGLLWAEQSEAHARQSLNQALYNLRGAIGDRPLTGSLPTLSEPGAPSTHLIVTPQTIQFDPASDHRLDVSTFASLIDACRRHPHTRLETCVECAARLEQAVALYRGDFLAGFTLSGGSIAFDEWAVTRREELRQLCIAALADLAGYHDGRGDTARALRYARRCVELDPLWEAGQRSLMRLLVQDEQREAALKQYQGFRKALKAELAVEPERETQALYERLRSETRPTSIQRDNLPAQTTAFIGRQTELAELTALLKDPDCRLVTVFGPGGVGKTRLALQVTSRLSYTFADGVFFLSLSSLPSIQSLLPSIVLALGFKLQEGSDPQPQLLKYLRGKQILLLLDGFETLPEAKDWLSDLLHAASGVKALVTSRVKLNLKSEHIFHLGGMSYPQPEKTGDVDFNITHFSAMQLFLASAQRTEASLEWGKECWQDMAKICHLVQGMPLGLLLASAWVETYTMPEIAAEIERSLDFLESRWGDLPARQRSLRAMLDYSYNLLTPWEQELFCKLSTFRGGFTRGAAAAVAGADARLLQGLVDKTMLDAPVGGRYAMHDMVHQFALEKLAGNPPEERAARSAHAAYYLGRLPFWEMGLKSASQLDVLVEMDAETSNLGAAWNWAGENQDVTLLTEGLEGLCLFASLRARYQEGQIACQNAIDHLSKLSDRQEVMRLSVQANGWSAHFLRLMGKHEEAVRLLVNSLIALDCPELQGVNTCAERAFLLLELGSALLPTDRHAAGKHYRDSLALSEEINDPWRQARALAGLGMVAHHSGTFESAMHFYERSLELYEETGDPQAIAEVLIELGHNSLRQGMLEQGEAYIRRGSDYYQQIGDRASIAESLFNLARLYFWRGNISKLLSITNEVEPIFREVGVMDRSVFLAAGKSFLIALTGDYENARQHGHQGVIAARKEKLKRYEALAFYGLGMSELGEGNAQRAGEYLQQSVSCYRAIEQTDELGWALAALAYADLGVGKTTEFLSHLCETLRLGVNVRALFTVVLAFPAIALYLVQRSRESQDNTADIERAVELYTLARCEPTAANAPWFEDTAGKTITAAAASLPPELVEAAKERGRELDLFATAEELLQELSQPGDENRSAKPPPTGEAGTQGRR